MPRSVNAVASRRRRKKVLKLAKGYFGARKNVWTVAKNTVERALAFAYRDRKTKKRNFRSLWIMRINAGVRQYGMSYSQFMGMYANSGLTLNRKVLADMAMNHSEVFETIVDKVKSIAESKPARVLAPPVAKTVKKVAAPRVIAEPMAVVAPVVEVAAPVVEAPVVEQAAPVVEAPVVEQAAPIAKKSSKADKGDDLKLVEGIGPAIEKLLHARDITTFAKLAETEVSFLKEILQDAGPRFRVHSPATWPQQSALAASGSWDELKVLQDNLNGGRVE